MARVRVRYKGLSDERIITQKDLEPLGISIDRDLVWAGHGRALTIDMTDELEAVLRREGTFSISEIKDDNTAGDEVVKATISDDTVNASEVVDKTTGQKEKRS